MEKSDLTGQQNQEQIVLSDEEKELEIEQLKKLEVKELQDPLIKGEEPSTNEEESLNKGEDPSAQDPQSEETKTQEIAIDSTATEQADITVNTDGLIIKEEDLKLWFEEISKEVYEPREVPLVRPDTIDKNAVVPEEVRFNFKRNNLKGRELYAYIAGFKFIDNHENVRSAHAYAKGGVAACDSLVKKFRSIATEIIAQVGRKILSGSFNLTTISFPIKAMVGESFLEKCIISTCMYPLYLNLASHCDDPLQRFKYVMAACISYHCYLEIFGKPLNPILGETMQGHYNDGTKVYLEQISHHPPISYLYIDGPNSSYTAYGPYSCTPSAGMNSLTLNAKGWRKFIFNDTKQEIIATTANDEYSGTFLGKCVYNSTGGMEFLDKNNKISAKIIIGKTKGCLNDYYSGEIKVDNKVVSKVNGTYLGWLEIDGNRYFDQRYVHPFKFNIEKTPLDSDSYRRLDILHLREGEIVKAQTEKNNLENIQRGDRKLREKFQAEKKKAK